MPIFRPARRRGRDAVPLGATPDAVARRLLDSVLEAGRAAYPNEFGGVLKAEPPGVIGEWLLLPGTTAGRRHANFRLYMMPADLGVVGTVHSHPSGALRPSAADLQLFRSWGRRHLIVGSPFGVGAWRAYNGNGDETSLEVVGPGLGRAGAPLAEYRPRPRAGAPAPTEPFPEDEE